MTALSADRFVRRYSSDAVPVRGKTLPVAASTTIYGGSIVALNQSGYAVPASADPTLHVVGVAVEKADNASGSAGAVSVEIQRGVFSLNNSSSTSALTDADIGRVCFAADDNTVARITAIGTLPPVGKVVGLDGSDVFVEVGLLAQGDDGSALDLLIVAGADLSSTGQYRFVSLNSSGAIVLAATAGMNALGVLLNAPASGAVGIVRRRGRVRMLASANITEGTAIAVEGTNGRAKAASALTCDASGASATAASTGSYVMGMALEEATGAADMFLVDIHPMGAIPGTAA